MHDAHIFLIEEILSNRAPYYIEVFLRKLRREAGLKPDNEEAAN